MGGQRGPPTPEGVAAGGHGGGVGWAGQGRSWLPSESPARRHPLPERKLKQWPAEPGAGGARCEFCFPHGETLPRRLGKASFARAVSPAGQPSSLVTEIPARRDRVARELDETDAKRRVQTCRWVASLHRWGWMKRVGY